MRFGRFFASALAIVAMSVSCQKTFQGSGDTVKVRINANPASTKTVFGDKEGSEYPVLWTTSSKVAVHVGYKAAVEVLPSKAGVSTSFEAELPAATSGMLRVFSPVGVYDQENAANIKGGFTQQTIIPTSDYTYCVIPTTQVPVQGSCDESAQLVAASMEIPSSGLPSSIDMEFSLVNAFGKLVLKNIDAESISQVSLSFPVSVAGTSVHYDLESGVLSNANSRNIMLDASGIQKDSEGNFVLFFGCVPAEMTSGKFEITAVDGDGSVHTKNVQLSSTKALVFTAGHVKPINVEFDSVVEGDDEWTLVTDASVLSAGDQIVLASNAKGVTAADLDGAILNTATSAFSADKTIITGLGEGTMVFTLDGSAGAWKLMSGEKALGATAVKKLAWDSGTMTWTITCDNSGNATISSTTGSYGRFLYNVSSPRFTTYTSDTNVSMLLPQIYRKGVSGSGSGDVQEETVVETEGASSVTTDSAILDGSYENALQMPYEAGFEWGTSENDLKNVAQCQSALAGISGEFHASLRNLDPGKTYYFRAYIVVLENGTYEYHYGEVYSFDTNSQSVSTSAGVPKWFELPAQRDVDHNGIDDDNSDLYYSWTMRSDAPKIRNFSAAYSKSKIHPVWAAAPMHSSYKGSASRTNAYKDDPAIACEQSAKFDGYTRGHMIGSSDRTVSSATNRQVFYYSNIGAQIQTGFNTGGGAWNNLEDLVDAQFCSDTLYQVVGAIFETFTDKYGSTVAKKTGTNGAGSIFQVPTAWYTVVLRTKAGNTGKRVDQCSASELKCAAFILPHKSNAGHKPTSKDLYTVEELEALTGLDFFVNVPNAPKSTVSASDWGL